MDESSGFADDTASPTNSTHSVSTDRSSFQSHARTRSVATETTGPERPQRFSIQFPVQLAEARAATRTSISPTREPAPTPSDATASSSAPGGNFLTAIATQERKVLELKEELQKAEAELDRLKKQWTQHESKKNLSDAKRLTRLEPVQTSLPISTTEDDTDGSNAWMQHEMERRKALLSGSRHSTRTVFSGSKHTRALSLLSPPNGDANATETRARTPTDRPTQFSPDVGLLTDEPKQLKRASTMSTITNGLDDTDLNQRGAVDRAIDHDALIRQGKKMANDFRDGLWTFWEDLRQATVGEEATQTALYKKQNPSHTLRETKKQSSNARTRQSPNASGLSRGSAGAKTPSPARAKPPPDLANPSFWAENEATPSQIAPSRKKEATPPQNKDISHFKSTASTSKSPSVASNDPWDTWDDSPLPSRTSSVVSESVTNPSTLPGSAGGSNRSSRETPVKDALPWPALKKLGPTNLRRTASHLMQEWENLERSISPGPAQEYEAPRDYLGANIEAAAYDAHGSGSGKAG